MRLVCTALLATLPATALGAPAPELVPLSGGDFVVLDLAAGEVDPALYDDLLEKAAGEAPADADLVEVWLDHDGGLVRMSDLLPAAAAVPAKEPAYRSFPTDNPGRWSGFLDGRAVYLSQCHGWIWYDSLGRFATQRGEHFDTVEDFHNPEGLNQFLAPYLENAGASTFAAKERGHNPNMAIADNDGEGYAETGSGFAGGEAGFAEQPDWTFGQDPFDEGTTRKFPADGGGVATWIPDVPVDGYYAVYVSWDAHSTHATDAHYRITHGGGVIDRWFDQTVHGSTWQYLDTLWLEAGVESLAVELIGDSSTPGRFLSADAVRVGGGMGDVVRFGDTSGRARWEEGAIQYAQFNGAPTSVYDPYGNGNGTDPTVRSRWAAWEHPSGEDALYLSWHSNACGSGDDCAARGTVTYIYESTCASGAAAAGSYDLAFAVNDELVSAFRALWEPGWVQRGGSDGVAEACFAEVNPGHNPEMPAALVELAFHNNVDDAAYLKQPEFRRDAARAMYRGIVRYFAGRDGLTPRYLPEPPVDVGVVHGADGRLLVTWAPGPAGDPFGDPAQGYQVFTSTDGRSWDGGTSADGTSAVLDTPSGDVVFVRVAAVNAGGISFASEVVGARRSPDGVAPVLVVAAFDRFGSSLLPWEDAGPTGMVRRMYLPRVNPFDVAVAHGRAIADAGWYFDAVSDEVFDDLDLAPYALVVWAAGEESTSDDTFSPGQQAKLRAFVDGGGALWASGAEILWDLVYAGDAVDQAFAAEVLGATFDSDDAGTTVVNGEGLLEGAGPLDFGEDVGGAYPVEYPDTLSSSNPVIARYAGGDVAGVLGERAVVFGFPFETIGDPSVRAEVARRLLPALVPEYDPPDPGDDPDDPQEGDWPRHEIPRGCGCTGVPPAPWGAVALLSLVAVVVRRPRKR